MSAHNKRFERVKYIRWAIRLELSMLSFNENSIELAQCCIVIGSCERE